jgi:NAD(P)-dependent dehydrogenase (short-subunit alcohol dehydrogenase family)
MTVEPQPFPTERTAIVTGAGGERGIGRHVARRIARDGWSVVVVDIDEPAALSFADELGREIDQKVLGLGLDVTDQDAVRAAFERIDAEMPPVLAEVNLAGIPCSDPFMDVTVETWDRVMAVNAKGTFLMMQEVARRMIEHGRGGRIVNTSSITAYDGGGTVSKAAYAAAKAAVLGLTRGGARELGAHQITVNAIVPGPIDTDIMGGRLTDERKTAMSAGIPLQRVGQPAEVAGLINYLISEEAGYTSGAAYFIDGGKHMI